MTIQVGNRVRNSRLGSPWEGTVAYIMDAATYLVGVDRCGMTTEDWDRLCPDWRFWRVLVVELDGVLSVTPEEMARCGSPGTRTKNVKAFAMSEKEAKGLQ